MYVWYSRFKFFFDHMVHIDGDHVSLNIGSTFKRSILNVYLSLRIQETNFFFVFKKKTKIFKTEKKDIRNISMNVLK